MERKPLILIVEDEKEIAKFIDLELQAENYETVVSYDGVTGLSKFRELNPDLVVLDLMLPGLDGYQVLQRIRADGERVPVLILSARAEEADKVLGFRLGEVRPGFHARVAAAGRALARGGEQRRRPRMGAHQDGWPRRTGRPDTRARHAGMAGLE